MIGPRRFVLFDAINTRITGTQNAVLCQGRPKLQMGARLNGVAEANLELGTWFLATRSDVIIKYQEFLEGVFVCLNYILCVTY